MVRTIGLVLVLALTSAASAQRRAFTFGLIDGGTSQEGSILISCAGSGAFIGDWNPVFNPDGTRTKPGASGPFEPGENLSIPASLRLLHDAEVASPVTGLFGLTLYPSEPRVAIYAMKLDLVGGVPLDVDLSVVLVHDAFRTRDPDAVFQPSSTTMAELPTAQLTEFEFNQGFLIDGVITRLTPISAEFQATIGGRVDGTLEFDGQSVELARASGSVVLDGEVVFDDESATFSGSATLSVAGLGSPAPMWAAPMVLAVPGGSGEVASLMASSTISARSTEADLVISGLAAEPLPPCYADCDGDLRLTIFDMLCFQNLWEFSDPFADCDGDGLFTLFDWLCFQNSFDTGCR